MLPGLSAQGGVGAVDYSGPTWSMTLDLHCGAGCGAYTEEGMTTTRWGYRLPLSMLCHSVMR